MQCCTTTNRLGYNGQYNIMHIPLSNDSSAYQGCIGYCIFGLLRMQLWKHRGNRSICVHDDVIKWKHFPRYWPFVRGIHRVNSPHKGQWHGALVFALICVWIDGWVRTREAGDSRCYRAHYDVTVMLTTVANDKSIVMICAALLVDNNVLCIDYKAYHRTMEEALNRQSNRDDKMIKIRHHFLLFIFKEFRNMAQVICALLAKSLCDNLFKLSIRVTIDIIWINNVQTGFQYDIYIYTYMH